MIQAILRIIGDDGYDAFDGPVTLPTIPPIGGHVRIMDRNSNYRRLYVEDLVVGAVRQSLLDEMPNLAARETVIRIYGSETSDSGGL